MKLYNVFRLFVVKKNDIKFICKKDNKPNTYTELFTNEKLETENGNEVEPLSQYYSVTQITVYRNRISKRGLLLKYIEINNREKNKILTKNKVGFENEIM